MTHHSGSTDNGLMKHLKSAKTWLALILVLGLAVSAYLILRYSQAKTRLLIYCHDAYVDVFVDNIKVENYSTLIELDLPFGRHVLEFKQAGKLLERAERSLRANRIHLYSYMGLPLYVDSGNGKVSTIVAAGEALGLCPEHGMETGPGTSCRSCSNELSFLSLQDTIALLPRMEGIESRDLQSSVVITNPLLDEVEVDMFLDSTQTTFTLSQFASRVVRAHPGQILKLECRTDGELVQSAEIVVDAQTTLFTCGGFALYKWFNIQDYDQEKEGGDLIMASVFSSMKLAPKDKIFLSYSPAGSGQAVMGLEDEQGEIWLLKPVSAHLLSATQIQEASTPIYLAPGYTISEVRPHKSLRNKHLEQVLVGEERILGLFHGRAYNFFTGDELAADGNENLISLHFFADGLLAMTDNFTLAKLDDGQWVGRVDLLSPQIRLLSRESSRDIFATGMAFKNGLAHISSPQPRTYFEHLEHITAAYMTKHEILVVADQELHRLDLETFGEESVLRLPLQEISAICAHEGRVYFSNPDGVYVLDNDILQPLVTGIQANIYSRDQSLILHDAGSGKLFALTRESTAQ